MREEIVKIEIELGNHADVIAGAFFNRNNRIYAKLEMLPGPKDPGIDRPGRLSTLSPVQRSFESELDQWNQAIEGRVPVHVLHLRLEVLDAVFQRKTPFQDVRIPLDVDFRYAGHFADRRRWPGRGSCRCTTGGR